MSDDEKQYQFIDVSALATPRLRRIAEIMSHLPDDERQELAALIFDEAESIADTINFTRGMHDRRSN